MMPLCLLHLNPFVSVSLHPPFSPLSPFLPLLANPFLINLQLTIEQFKTNLHELISLVRSPSSPHYSPSTKLLLITPPPVDAEVRGRDLLARDPPRVPDRDAERTRLFAEAVKEVGKEAEIPAVDAWTRIDEAAKRDGGLGKYLNDGLHLTAEGYKLVTIGELGHTLGFL